MQNVNSYNLPIIHILVVESQYIYNFGGTHEWPHSQKGEEELHSEPYYNAHSSANLCVAK